MQNVLDYKTVLNRYAEACSKSEKCASQAIEYALKKGLTMQQAKKLADYLIENNFINHQRFANAFAADKAKFAKWGPNKIANVLKNKGIEQNYIDNALRKIPQENLDNLATSEIEKKAKKTKYKDFKDLRAKLLRFSFSRGYNITQSEKTIETIINQLKTV